MSRVHLLQKGSHNFEQIEHLHHSVLKMGSTGAALHLSSKTVLSDDVSTVKHRSYSETFGSSHGMAKKLNDSLVTMVQSFKVILAALPGY